MLLLVILCWCLKTLFGIGGNNAPVLVLFYSSPLRCLLFLIPPFDSFLRSSYNFILLIISPPPEIAVFPYFYCIRFFYTILFLLWILLFIMIFGLLFNRFLVSPRWTDACRWAARILPAAFDTRGASGVRCRV